MPPLVAALAVYIGTIAAAIVVYGAVIITLASIAYSAYMMASMEKPGSGQSDATNRLQTVRSSVQPHRVIYGEVMTSGVLVYAQSHSIDPLTNEAVSGDNVFISLVITICAHEIESIDEVWFNDKLSTDNIFTKYIPEQPEEGYYTGGDDTNLGTWVITKPLIPAQTKSYTTITKYLGTLDQTADSFLVSLPPKPTSIITKNPDSGLNDFSIVNAGDGSGTFSGIGMAVFTIRITATGASDTFQWSEDKYAGDGTTVTNVASGTTTITGASQLLAEGISIKFDAVTGHSVAQTWEIKTFDGAPWTENCLLTNRAYLVVTLEKHNESFPNGLPNIKCLVKGNNKIYDPRTATSAYSKNWTLCVRDYLKKSYGLNVPDSDINDDITISTANICDEDITLADGSTQKRYVLNGSFTVDKTPTAIMNEILLSAFGAITWTQGKYRILPAAYYAPDPTFHGINVDVLGLTESDLKGPLKIRPTPSLKDKFNTIKGTYISSETWQEVDFPKVSNALYKAQDGGVEIVKDVKFTYITNAAMAQRVAKIILEKSRQSINIDFSAKWSAFPLTVGSNVPISISHLGFVEKIFTVRDWKLQPEGGVELILQEDAVGCYEWNSGEETTIDLAQNTVLADPRFVSVLNQLNVGEELYVTNGVSGAKSRVILTWSKINVAYYEVNYRPPNNTIWASLPVTTDTTCLVDDTIPGLYSFRIRCMNFLGIWGDWFERSYTVLGNLAPLPNITGLTNYYSGIFTRLKWTPITDLRPFVYEIRFGDDFATAMILDTSVTHDYPATSNGTYWVTAKYTIRGIVIYSTTPASLIIGGSVLTQNVIATYDEHATGWTGTLADGAEIDGANRVWLKLETPSTGDLGPFLLQDSSSLLLQDDTELLMQPAQIVMSSGTYTIPSGHVVDLGSDVQCNLSVQYTALSDNPNNLIDAVLDFDELANMDGDYAGYSDVQIQVRIYSYTSASWGTWQNFIAGPYIAGKIDWRASLTSVSNSITAVLSEFAFTVDMPDKTDLQTNVSIAAIGTAIVYAKPFQVAPNVQVTILNAVAGDKIGFLAGPSTTGLTLQITNGGTSVARNCNIFSQAY